MDEEDILRNGGALLKMPTFVIQKDNSTITTTQSKINLDSGLLMKPRLEFGQTLQWGSSKTQPRLDSTDFLSKTNFAAANTFGAAAGLGSMVAPAKATFGSPSHAPGSFSPHPSGGIGALKLEPPKPTPPTSSNFMTNPTTGLFNTKPATTNNFPTFQNNQTSFGSKQLGSSWPSTSTGTLNGSVFKTPPFPTKTAFGQSSAFGVQPKPSAFGSNAPAFGQQPFVPPKPVAATSFGQSNFVPPKPPPPSFGGPPNRTFGTTTVPAFGSTAFGNSGSLGLKRPYTATSSIPPAQRNGEISQEPVFGSKAKIRRMLATKESQQKKKAAFEQYAEPADTKLSSNPFADAMQRAKNPMPRRHTDSDVIEESTGSSDYSEEYDSELSEVSGFTDEEPQEPIPEVPVLTEMERGPSVPYAVAMTPAQPYASPTKLPTSPIKPHMSPVKLPPSPVKQLSPIKSASQSPEKLPVINDVGHESEEVSSIPSPTPEPELEPVLSSPTRKPKRRSKSKTPQRVPSNTSSPAANHEQVPSPLITKKIKRAEDIIKEIESPKPASRRASRQTSKTSPDHLKTTPNHVSPAHKPNGDILREDRRPSNEVWGHIDLDAPAMSLSIPQLLLNQATGKPNKKAAKVRKPSGRPRRQSARTPNYPSIPTPSQVPPTPAYPTAPSTPEHPSATPAYPVPATPAYRPETPMYAPPTPAYPSQTPSHPSSAAPNYVPRPVPVRHDRRIHAPTKAEMMEKMMKKQRELERAKKAKKARKARIGPKSYMRKLGKQVESEPEEQLVDDSSLFYKSEFLSQYSGRTDQSAPYRARFKQNQLYLCYLRRRALDLVHTLFPDIRCGGNFCPETEDIDGLLEYIITSLKNQDSSTRCMHSLPDSGREAKNRIEVRVCRAGKNTVRSLQRKLIILLKLVLPSLSLQQIEKEGIQTLPKLIHKVITENSVR